MTLRFALAAAVLLVAAPALAQISYDGQITEPEWFTLDDDTGGPGNGFGDFNTLNASYADIADDGSSISLGLAGLVDRNSVDDNRNFLVVLLDTRAGGYNTGNFGRADGPGGARGVTNFNSGSTFDDGFFADYALQISCGASPDDCYFDLYTLSGTAASGGGPNTFLGTEADPDLGSFLDFGDTNTRTRGYEVRLTASGDGVGTDIQLDRPSFQAFAFIINATSGFLSNQFMSPAGGGDGNYGDGAVNFNAATPDPVVYAEQEFVDQRTPQFRDRGYRMLAVPTADMTVNDLAAQDLVRFQGDGSAIEVLTDYTMAGFVRAPSGATVLGAGEGFLWYLYDGRTPNSQGPTDPQSRVLPYTFEAGGKMVTDVIGINHAVTNMEGNANGFYLAGNPFVEGLRLSEISSPDATILDAVYVYDPFSRSYESFSRAAGDVLAPLQGFMLEMESTISDATWVIPPSARASGGVFVPSNDEEIIVVSLQLERRTETGWERADALALARGEAMDTGKPTLAPDGRPLATRLTAESAARGGLGQIGVPASGLRAPLALDAAEGEYRFVLRGVLDGQTVHLTDAATGETVSLDSKPYSFSARGDLAGRFALTIAPETGAPLATQAVGDVYPNPATGSARVLVDLPQRQRLRVEVLDLLGRVVTVAFEGEAGTEALPLDTRVLAPGAYLVRVSGETVYEVRRLTVVR